MSNETKTKRIAVISQERGLTLHKQTTQTSDPTNPIVMFNIMMGDTLILRLDPDEASRLGGQLMDACICFAPATMAPPKSTDDLVPLNAEQVSWLRPGELVDVHYWKNDPEDVRIDHVEHYVAHNRPKCIELAKYNGDPDDPNDYLEIEVSVDPTRHAIMDLGSKGHLTISRLPPRR